MSPEDDQSQGNTKQFVRKVLRQENEDNDENEDNNKDGLKVNKL